MTKFSLYTERKNISLLRHTCATFFDSFTLVKAKGYWQGKGERSLIIEVLSQEYTRDRANIDQLALRIKVLNRQECVLVTEQPIHAEFV